MATVRKSSKIQKPAGDEFPKFKAECLRQVERLGLKDWDVTIDTKKLDKSEVAISEINDAGKVVTIYLNSKYSHEDPERIAKHEIAHLLLSRLIYIAHKRFASETELAECEEGLCTILEKVL